MDKQLREALAEGRPVKAPALAKALDLSRNGFYEAVKRGDIASVRVGRAIRIPAREAQRLLGIEAA